MPVCFYSALCRSAGAVAMTPLNISCSSDFYAQPMISRYRFISPIKTPCRCPHISRPRLLICSPRFSAWLINKCPCSFAQLVSHSSHRLNEEEKHIPFWCTSERTQTPHQVVLITASRPYRAMCQWPPSLGPAAAGLCTPDKWSSHQPPPHHHHHHFQPPPFIILELFSPLFCPPSVALSPIYTPTPHSLPAPFPPRLFLYVSFPYSSPPVIRSRWPPAGVNGGENQPRVSECISSFWCPPASNEDGHCQNSASHCARHRWAHNEQCV